MSQEAIPADNMQQGIWYVVVNPSKHGEMQEGDHVRLITGGRIACKEAQGWIERSDVTAATEGATVVIDWATVAQQRAKLRAKLDALPVLPSQSTKTVGN